MVGACLAWQYKGNALAVMEKTGVAANLPPAYAKKYENLATS
jgi:hypothetical protein